MRRYCREIWRWKNKFRTGRQMEMKPYESWKAVNSNFSTSEILTEVLMEQDNWRRAWRSEESVGVGGWGVIQFWEFRGSEPMLLEFISSR